MLTDLFSSQWTWNHLCDSYPMYAILDAKTFSQPKNITDAAYLYDTVTNRFLYTYEITNPNNDSIWYFRLRDWNVDQANISLKEYPTLQSVGYNLADNTITGNCTLPSPSNSASNITTSSCVSGTFDPGDHLFFNITSAVPLNNTVNTNAIQRTTTMLKNKGNVWTFHDGHPVVSLHQADAVSGKLGHVVLRTSISPRSDPTELKACLSGVDGWEGVQAGAEVMAPLGIVLMKQADFATWDTTPSNETIPPSIWNGR